MHEENYDLMLADFFYDAPPKKCLILIDAVDEIFPAVQRIGLTVATTEDLQFQSSKIFYTLDDSHVRSVLHDMAEHMREDAR